MSAPFSCEACQLAGALLRARGLSCTRGGRVLFRDVNLTVGPGELVWLRGANGQGKSSLLRLLAGLARPAAGEVDRGGPLVYLGHEDALHADLHAWEALRFLVQLQPLSMPAALPASPTFWHAALAQAGVGHCAHRPIHALSQGQRKRVALARLQFSPPAALWLLDEPLDALDDQGVYMLSAWVQGHRARGGAVVLTSHQNLPLALAGPHGSECLMFDLTMRIPSAVEPHGDEVYA